MKRHQLSGLRNTRCRVYNNIGTAVLLYAGVWYYYTVRRIVRVMHTRVSPGGFSRAFGLNVAEANDSNSTRHGDDDASGVGGGRRTDAGEADGRYADLVAARRTAIRTRTIFRLGRSLINRDLLFIDLSLARVRVRVKSRETPWRETRVH